MPVTGGLSGANSALLYSIRVEFKYWLKLEKLEPLMARLAMFAVICLVKEAKKKREYETEGTHGKGGGR